MISLQNPASTPESKLWTAPLCDPNLLNSPHSHGRSPPHTGRGQCCSCRRWSWPRKTQSRLEMEEAFRSGYLCQAPPPDLQLYSLPPFPSSFSKEPLKRLALGTPPLGYSVSFPAASTLWSSNCLILRSQQIQGRVDLQSPSHHVQCLVPAPGWWESQDAVGLFC